MTRSKTVAMALMAFALSAPIAMRAADPSSGQDSLPAQVSLRGLADTLRENLADGSIRAAHLHAIELEMAVNGTLPQETASKVEQLTAQLETDRDPSLSKRLVPWVDQLIQALDEGDTANAKSYAYKLFTEIHEVYTAALRQRIATAAKLNTDPIDIYISRSGQLYDFPQHGDITRAESMAIEVQRLQATLPQKVRFLATYAQNVYNINDALGRSAFKRGDYLTAGDYLLKAADTRGSGSLSTFGPDLWLAQKLLDAGQRDVVLTFFQRCKNFWPSPKLDRWITDLQNGQTPDLRSNIRSESSLTK
jgi:hypothetical protein